MGCAEDEECPLNMLCYSGVSWFEEELRGLAQDGCFCNSFYGWEGYPECAVLTTSSMVTVGWNAASALVGMLAAGWLARVAARFHREGKLLHFTSVNMTLLLAFGAAVGATVWAVVVLLSTVVRSGPAVGSLPDQYKGRFNSILWLFSPLSIACGALSLLNVAVTWIEIATATKRFSDARLNKLKRTVYSFEVAAVLLGVGGVVYEKVTGTSIMGFVLSPLIFVVIVLYLYGAYRLNTILHASGTAVGGSLGANTSVSARTASIDSGSTASAAGGQEARQRFGSLRTPRLKGRRETVQAQEPHVFERVMRKVRNTTVAVTVCVLLFWVASLGISSVDVGLGWKEITPPRTFSYVKAFHHLQMTAIALGALTLAAYFSAKTGNGGEKAATEKPASRPDGCGSRLVAWLAGAKTHISPRKNKGQTRQTEMEWLAPRNQTVMDPEGPQATPLSYPQLPPSQGRPGDSDLGASSSSGGTGASAKRPQLESTMSL